jgi:predicted transcriptional regulator
MTIQDVADALELRILCTHRHADRTVQGGYASDMLSCVMAGAKPGNVWVTLLTHLNVIAVAVLTDVAAVIVTENAEILPEVLAKAEEEGVVVLRTADDTYSVVGRLYALGIT